MGLKHDQPHHPTIAVLGTRGFPGVQGGVENHCQHIYPLMPSYGFRVFRRKPYLTPQSHHAHWPNITFVDWHTTRVQGLEATWHTLRAVMHCIVHRPDLVHVHNMGPALLALPLKLLGIPLVMTYHSVNYEHSKWGRCTRWLLRQSERLSLRYSDRIIFVNRKRMEQMPAYVQRKSVYIPNGVEQMQPVDDTSLLQQRGISPGRYVLAVGRITPEKGLEYLVEAANRSHLIEQVVIAGDYDHNDDYLMRLVGLDTHNKVVFTGYVDGPNINQLYSHARLLALPSLSEGLPLSLLEAMAHHLPIVASDIDATRLMSLPESSYCAAGDTAALQQAIEDIISQPQRPVDYDLSAHDWPTIAEHTQQVFADILSPKG